MIYTSRKNLVKSATIIMLLTVLSKLFGFVRETVIAGEFGANSATDAYLVALILPQIIFTLTSGALVVVFVPILSNYFYSTRYEEAWKIVNTILNAVCIILLLISILGSIFSEYLIPLVGFGFNEQTSQLAIKISQIVFFMSFFLSIAALFSGVLNAYKKFFIPAFAPILSSIFIIFFSLFLSKYFGILALAYGTVLGAFAQMIVHIPALCKIGYKYKFYVDLNNKGVREFFILIMPIMLGNAVVQINFLVDRIVGSSLSAGSISALNYANKLIGLPMGIITLGIGTAILPTFSKIIFDDNKEELKKIIQYGMTIASLICIPASVGLIVLRVPIIRLLFEHGSFTSEATFMTAGALFYYTIGLITVVWRDIIVRVFFSFKDTTTPVKLSIISVLLNIVLTIILSKFKAHEGIALATTIANGLNMLLLWIYLNKKIGKFLSSDFFINLIKIFAASLITGLIAVLVYQLLIIFNLLLSLTISILAAIIVYIIMLYLLKIKEFIEIYNKISIKLVAKIKNF